MLLLLDIDNQKDFKFGILDFKIVLLEQIFKFGVSSYV